MDLYKQRSFDVDFFFSFLYVILLHYRKGVVSLHLVRIVWRVYAALILQIQWFMQHLWLIRVILRSGDRTQSFPPPYLHVVLMHVCYRPQWHHDGWRFCRTAGFKTAVYTVTSGPSNSNTVTKSRIQQLLLSFSSGEGDGDFQTWGGHTGAKAHTAGRGWTSRMSWRQTSKVNPKLHQSKIQSQ